MVDLVEAVSTQTWESAGRISLLHLIHSPQLRGAELFATQLAGALGGRRFENTICSLFEAGFNNGLPDQSNFLSLRARRRGIAAKLGLQPTLLLKLARVVGKFGPDIVVAHGADTLKYAVFGKFVWGAPITVYRNIGFASSWATSSRKKWGVAALLHGVDAVVSVSQATREDFVRVYGYPPTKIVTIPNGCDPRPYQELSSEPNGLRQALGLKKGDAVLVSVGSLSSEKNYGYLFSLVRRLRERGFRSHLLLVGDGPLRKQLEQEARETQVEPFVHFLGIRTDVPQLLKVADLFLLPSKTEGMPAVLIEAGMAGLSCVAYDVGGVREVVEPGVTGILVPPGDSIQFEAAVVSLLEDRGKRKELGARAQQHCLERFSMEKVAKQYEDLFIRLLAERGERSNGTS